MYAYICLHIKNSGSSFRAEPGELCGNNEWLVSGLRVARLVGVEMRGLIREAVRQLDRLLLRKGRDCRMTVFCLE